MRAFLDALGRRRRLPVISQDLLEQVMAVPASHGALSSMHYRPCRVTLTDGPVLERVYVAEAEAYARVWGVWPEDDPGKQAVPLERVARVQESPYRLPVALANKMYAAGESGMGYCVFTLVLRDGRRVSCGTGNAVDFPGLPEGVAPDMIVDLLPHVADRSHVLPPAPYAWCLYALPDDRSGP